MATFQGNILSIVHGGADNPAINMVRCTYAGALANGSVVQFGDTLAFGGNFQQYLPQGSEIVDSILRCTTAGETVSVQVGYAAADGSASTTNGVPDVNATYLNGTTAIAASGITRATGPTAVVQLQRTTVPTLTVASGAFTSEAIIELDIFYKYTGNQGANTVEVS